MSVPRATSGRPVPHSVLGSAVVAALLVVSACTGEGKEEPDAAPTTAGTTALADLAPGGLAIVRAPFCDAVADADVETALDGPVESTRSWENGDKVGVDGGSDVAHEFGCTWRGTSPAAAEAWVFAPPVSAGRAREVVRAEQERPGCRPLPDAAPFGEPGAALLCRADGALVASYRGLFGDAWLTCTLTAADGVDESDLAARADRWCAAVVGAAAG